MNFDTDPILDNPAWNALQTVHKEFAIGTETFQRYPVGMLQVVGCSDPVIANLQEIEPWVMANETVLLVGELPAIPVNWEVLGKYDCVQMICPQRTDLSLASEAEIFQLTKKDNEDMLDLIKLALPGFFYKDTPLLGSYFGIKYNGQLVAMTGERMRITGHTEISAVCTHPSFTGKGFAQQLVKEVTNKNIDEGCLPFLHVSSSNSRAIKVYELLGYKIRKAVPFWQLTLNRKAVPF